jgi:hypothetical protein
MVVSTWASYLSLLALAVAYIWWIVLLVLFFRALGPIRFAGMAGLDAAGSE